MSTPPYDTWYPESTIDGTYGYDEAALRRVGPAPVPDGFADLWSSWYADAIDVPADPELTPLGTDGAHELFRIRFTAADGLRLGGWLGLPTSGVATSGVIHAHGYGGREFPELGRVPDDAAVIFPVARGLGALSRMDGIPSESSQHVLHGIDSIETYAPARSAVDLWHAGTTLLEVLARFQSGGGDLPLYLIGGSFGGGIGAMAAPWDERVVGATLTVPTFGGQDLRLTMPCDGSGEAVRLYTAAHPEARRVLHLADASAAIGFARIPIRLELALWDTFVPPPGQFAVAAAVPHGLRELVVRPAGHAWYPGRAGDDRADQMATWDHLLRAVQNAEQTATFKPVNAA